MIECACGTLSVMPGLDPGIHDQGAAKEIVSLPARKPLMDCRVKPGNDCGGIYPNRALSCGAAKSSCGPTGTMPVGFTWRWLP
jgi:hypothetical protein